MYITKIFLNPTAHSQCQPCSSKPMSRLHLACVHTIVQGLAKTKPARVPPNHVYHVTVPFDFLKICEKLAIQATHAKDACTRVPSTRNLSYHKDVLSNSSAATCSATHYFAFRRTRHALDCGALTIHIMHSFDRTNTALKIASKGSW